MASHAQRPSGERLVVGITGRIGSGKTTIGKYLESGHGFQYLRYSAVLADWLAQDAESKAHLQKVGWEVMASGMQAELNRRLVSQILPQRDVAVDGLRHSLDYDTLRDLYSPSFFLLFVDSPPQLRFERLNAKGKYADFASFKAADSHPVEQQIDSLRIHAALVIQNDGSLQNLYTIVDETVSRFRKEGQI
jgi:dephospho-CoA kinase